MHIVRWDPAASEQQHLDGGAEQRLLQGVSPLRRDLRDSSCWHGRASAGAC
jgi:hypothetical protein